MPLEDHACRDKNARNHILVSEFVCKCIGVLLDWSKQFAYTYAHTNRHMAVQFHLIRSLELVHNLYKCLSSYGVFNYLFGLSHGFALKSS